MNQWYVIILAIIGVIILYYLSNKMQQFFSEMKDIKYQKCCFAIDVTLNMEKILSLPHFMKDDKLLSIFNSKYLDPNLDKNWHRIIFIIKDNLVFVNGKLTPYVGHTISLPNELKPNNPFKIIVGLRDSDLVIYYEPDALSIDTIARFPLAYVAYAYNYHPHYLSQKYYSEDAPEFGTAEKDLKLKIDYDRLRTSIIDGKTDNKLEAKFIALKKQLLEKNGFKEIGEKHDTDNYYNEKAGVVVKISQLDHGLDVQ